MYCLQLFSLLLPISHEVCMHQEDQTNLESAAQFLLTCIYLFICLQRDFVMGLIIRLQNFVQLPPLFQL